MQGPGANGSATPNGRCRAGPSAPLQVQRPIYEHRHLHAAPICYGARLMNTPAKALPVNHAWKIDESLDLYQVEAWGKGYFSINADGHVVIRPNLDASREIDLYDVVQGLKARDL